MLSVVSLRCSIRLRRMLIACRNHFVPLLVVALCCSSAALFSAFASARPVAIESTPTWVQTAVQPAVQTSAPASDDAEVIQSASGGTVCLLNDRQTRVSPSGVERYYRQVNKVLNATGLDDVSQLELEFEPSYQKLIIHHVWIRRGESTINALKPGDIKVVQKEEELAQRLYNGTLSAVVFLNDVRVGDVIDYDYSVNGDNPVLGSQYVDAYPLGARVATEKLRCRLLWPASRKLLYRNRNSDLQPAVKQSGDQTEYLWEQNHVKE